MQVRGRGGAGVVTWAVARVTEAAQINCVDTVAGGEQRDELVKCPPRLGESMDQQNRSSFRARSHVVEIGPVDRGVVVRDAGY